MIIVQCQMPLHAIVQSWKICTLEATGHLVLSNHVLGPLLLFMGLNVYLRREEEEEEEGEGGERELTQGRKMRGRKTCLGCLSCMYLQIYDSQ